MIDIFNKEDIKEIIESPKIKLSEITGGLSNQDKFLVVDEDFFYPLEFKVKPRYKWRSNKSVNTDYFAKDFDSYYVSMYFSRSVESRNETITGITLPKGSIIYINKLKVDVYGDKDDRECVKFDIDIDFSFERKYNKNIKSECIGSNIKIPFDILKGLKFTPIKNLTALERYIKINKALNSRSAGRRK